MSDLVSIITPLYGSRDFVLKAIQSVKNQTYTNWEMLIVDDCSNDGSIELVEKEISFDKRIKLFKNKNNIGAGPSRNVAIKAASGKYIAFLDSDDIWHCEKLEKQIEFMKKHDALFSHTSHGYIDESGKVIKSTYRVSNNPVNYRGLLKKTEIGCLTAVFDCEMIGKFYMPDLRRKQDYALWLNILKTGIESYPLDEELAWYRQRAVSNTSNKLVLIGGHWTFLREHEKLNFFESCYYLTCWAFGGFVKYFVK
jgi:teichuronic acid biosynthesis glycosyltransferase TuaG